MQLKNFAYEQSTQKCQVTNKEYLNKLNRLLNKIKKTERIEKENLKRGIRFYVQIFDNNNTITDSICIHETQGFILNDKSFYDNGELRKLIIDIIDYNSLKKVKGIEIDDVKDISPYTNIE